MYAAIKSIEDTLTIRQIQAREMGYDSVRDRQAAIMQDIASLQRGLKCMISAKNNPSDPSVQSNSAKCPTIGDPAQKTPEAPTCGCGGDNRFATQLQCRPEAIEKVAQNNQEKLS